MPSFWQETIHQLENRVQVLENALEISRDVIAKTEEKFDNLQRKGKKYLITLFERNLLELTGDFHSRNAAQNTVTRSAARC